MPSFTLRPNTVEANNNFSSWNGSSTVALSATHVSDDSDSTWVYANPQVAGYSARFGFTTSTMNSGGITKSMTLRIRANTHYGDSVVRSSLCVFGFQYGSFWDVHPPTTSPQTFTSSTYDYGLNQSQVDLLEYAVVNQISYNDIYELYIDVVYANPPTASAVSQTPATPITTTRKPTVTWTFNQGTDGTGGQYAFRVKVFSAAQYNAGGFDPASSTPTYDSGDVFSSTASHVLTDPLANGVTYKAYVMVYQRTSGVTQPATSYAAGSAFDISIAVPTPTSVTPASGSTQTTSRPALGASVAPMADGSKMRREWQFASDSGFTTATLTVTEPVGNLSTSPSGSFAFPALPTRRAQGTWYIRARALDESGIYGSYSAGQSFTISHPATTTNRAPSLGASMQYSTTPTFTWTFSDPDTDDFQTAKRVQLWKSSAPGTVLDSTKITGGAGATQLYQFTSGIDTTWKDTELRWKVQVYDQDDVSAGYSIENVFYLRDLPVPTITAPADAGVITTGAPLITWSFSATSGRTQAQWKVDILLSGTTLATSGWVAGTATSWQTPAPVVTVGPTHQVVVTVIDSVGLQGSDTNNFTANYAAPTTPSWFIDATNYASAGYNLIDWNDALSDGNFYSWEVYRRNVGDSTWKLILETTAVGTRQYKDYLAASQQPVEYVVVQKGISFGVYVESAYVAQETVGTSYLYLLVCPSLDTLNVVLRQVVSENFHEEQETAAINLIGRGRRIEYGTKWGQLGTLTANLRDVEPSGPTARQQRLAIEALRDANRIVYLHNPFGDVFQVSMTNVSFDRVAGVGLREYLQVTLDYSEITA